MKHVKCASKFIIKKRIPGHDNRIWHDDANLQRVLEKLLSKNIQ